MHLVNLQGLQTTRPSHTNWTQVQRRRMTTPNGAHRESEWATEQAGTDVGMDSTYERRRDSRPWLLGWNKTVCTALVWLDSSTSTPQAESGDELETCLVSFPDVHPRCDGRRGTRQARAPTQCVQIYVAFGTLFQARVHAGFARMVNWIIMPMDHI